jgi:hypothetical protein
MPVIPSVVGSIIGRIVVQAELDKTARPYLQNNYRKKKDGGMA